MKIIFFSTGEFGLPALKAIVGSKHDLLAVVTRPDQKKGRGWGAKPMPIKAVIEHIRPGLPVFLPETLDDKGFFDDINGYGADVFVVIDYGLKLSKEILNGPKKYCINLHPSLLPKHRGAAPVNWAIIKGETETGNTVFRMNEKMDAGDMILQEGSPILEKDDAVELLQKLSQKGAKLLLKSLNLIEAGEEGFSVQDEKEVSFAPKLKKNDGKIDWTEPANVIERKIKGLVPWPCAFTHIEGKLLKVFKTEIMENVYGSAPGTIVDTEAFIVATGKGALKLKKVQLEGKKAMPAKEFIKGYRIDAELVLGE